MDANAASALKGMILMSIAAVAIAAGMPDGSDPYRVVLYSLGFIAALTLPTVWPFLDGNGKLGIFEKINIALAAIGLAIFLGMAVFNGVLF